MAKFTVITNFNDLLGECPVWDEAQQALFWTDILGPRFYRYANGGAEILRQGLSINGFRLNEPGGYVITNRDGIWRWDGADGLALLARGQVNDCAADAAGRLLAGTWVESADEIGKLLRVNNNGSVSVLDEGFTMSNGLGFAPNNRTLYFTDSTTRRIYAYDYDVQSGTPRNRRVFVQVPNTEGLPDGLTVDAEGFVWSAQWYGGCVVRYDPDGKVERRLLTPAKQTTAVAFGGSELKQLFITTAAQSQPGPLMPPDYDAVNGYFGGRLYRVDLDIQGQPQFRTNIKKEN